MTQKEIQSDFVKETTVLKIKCFLEGLSNVYVFDKVDFIWKREKKVSVKYTLKKRTEEDLIKIFISKGEKTKILIQGEKWNSVEYFWLELNKILL